MVPFPGWAVGACKVFLRLIFFPSCVDQCFWYKDTQTSYSPLCPLLFQCQLEQKTVDELELHHLHVGNMRLTPSCHLEGGKILVLSNDEDSGSPIPPNLPSQVR